MYRIETEALAKKVHRALRTMIINGELHPGQKLIQDDLAGHLGVSRTPLLAAFSKLEKEHLVLTIPRRGAYVRRYTDRELLDLCNIRMRLEPLSAREAALAAGPEDIFRLENIAAEFDRAAEKQDEALLKQADYNFHTEILRIGGNTFLHDMLFSYIIIVINMSGLMRSADESGAEHHKILEALRAGDPDRAEALMLNHTRRPCRYLQPEEQGGSFCQK